MFLVSWQEHGLVDVEQIGWWTGSETEVVWNVRRNVRRVHWEGVFVGHGFYGLATRRAEAKMNQLLRCHREGMAATGTI